MHRCAGVASPSSYSKSCERKNWLACERHTCVRCTLRRGLHTRLSCLNVRRRRILWCTSGLYIFSDFWRREPAARPPRLHPGTPNISPDGAGHTPNPPPRGLGIQHINSQKNGNKATFLRLSTVSRQLHDVVGWAVGNQTRHHLLTDWSPRSPACIDGLIQNGQTFANRHINQE
jgi:hypothetical protein